MTEKKRSVFKPGALTDMPAFAANDKANKYRWLNAELLASATDGYEPRGWSIAKDPTSGNSIRRGDLILGIMPMDQWQQVKEYKDNERREQTQLFFEKQAADDERISHEFKKLGGRTKFEFKQE